MRKIINTFKYGQKATKRLLAVTFFSGAVAIAFAVAALVTQSLLFFFCAVICVFITISLAQSFGISRELEEELPGQEEMLLTGEAPIHNTTIEATTFEKLHDARKINRERKPDKQPRPKKIKANKAAKKAVVKHKKKQKKKISQTSKAQKLDRMGLSNQKNILQAGKTGHTIAKESDTGRAKEENVQKVTASHDPYGIFGGEVRPNEIVGDGISATANLLDMTEETTSKLQEFQASEEEFEQYTRVKVKKMLRKYKVKREHRLALVDQCEKYSIYQTPAYIWVADKLLHLLLIEKEPRHLTFPIYNIREITYRKKQRVNEDIDYAAFKNKNILTDLFRPYLPDYTHSTVVDDLSAYKNLYGIGPGVYFTNRSATCLFDLLAVDFAVEDKVTTSSKVNIYFKDAYKANILLRDNVIDANGYADRISGILDHMAHSTISYGEFKDTLNLMQKNKLITSEFAMYYMGVRDKK